MVQALEQLRAADPTAFIVLWHPEATEDAATRIQVGLGLAGCSLPGAPSLGLWWGGRQAGVGG